MRKIGLDLGSKTCGIAISDEKNKMALGLYNFLYSNNNLMLVIQKIKTIIAEYNQAVDGIVLGYPQVPNENFDNQSAIRVSTFKKLLEEHLKLEVFLVDESYSTQKATQILLDSHVKASQRKKVIDMVSAVVILQGFLDDYKKGTHFIQ